MDDQAPFRNLEQIAERALTFQRYIFRKAWGTYFAVWALAYVVFAFGWEVANFPTLSEFWSVIAYVLIYGGTGLFAGIATTWIFKNAHRTLVLRRALEPQRASRSYTFIWIWWAACYAIIFISFALFPKWGLTILFALLSSVLLIIYYGLNLSFRNRFPTEGWIALFSYGACITISFLISLLTANYTFIAITWGVMIAAWLFCALYAMWRSSEELVALIY